MVFTFLATDLSFTTFCDSDWVRDTYDRKFTAAYLIYMGPNAISWSPKKQPTVAKSSTEDEYRTITTTTELLWLHELLKKLGPPIIKAPQLFSDNIGATYLCVYPMFHTRMKHLVIDYHFVRDLVASKELQVSHVATSHQLANLFIKPLSHSRHAFLLDKIGVRYPSSILREHVDSLFIHQKQSSVDHTHAS